MSEVLQMKLNWSAFDITEQDKVSERALAGDAAVEGSIQGVVPKKGSPLAESTEAPQALNAFSKRNSGHLRLLETGTRNQLDQICAATDAIREKTNLGNHEKFLEHLRQNGGE